MSARWFGVTAERRRDRPRRRAGRAVVLATALLGALPSLLSTEPSKPVFKEITKEVGLEFVHDPGSEGRYLLPEIMGSGCAFLDYDNDGDLDIYLIQGGSLPESNKPNRAPNRLFRQDPGGRFTDVTTTSGLGNTGYGTGVAVGDVDNDGDVDVYVANYGADALYRNEGGGRFTDVTASAGIQGEFWSSSAAFCDYDNDGYLDLYVVHYVHHDPPKACVSAKGAPDYCSPQSFPYESDTLYHNNGDGTFTDVSRAAGIDRVKAAGLGVLCFDFTGDGLTDFYVANDRVANYLWENQGDGKFVDQAFMLGMALNAFGRPEASMGLTLGDADGDGDLDLFMTHLIDETNTLYLNDGNWGFEDVTAARGLAAPSLRFTGFGTAFFDYDHDGDLDIAIVDGRVAWGPPVPGASLGEVWNPYAEPNLLMENDGRGHFTDITARSGPFGAQIEVSRGLALGDVDGDGDLDILVSNTAGPARLFRNEAEKAGAWLGVRTLVAGGKRDAHGAVVSVRAGGKTTVRVANPGFSYLSSNDPRAHFGIPGAAKADAIVVRWPGGAEESFPGVALNQSIVLIKGQGKGKAKQR